MTKNKFRHSQIEMEGNDPMETGDAIGTPSDMAPWESDKMTL